MKFLLKVAFVAFLVVIGLKMLPGAVLLVEDAAAQFQAFVQGVVPTLPTAAGG